MSQLTCALREVVGCVKDGRERVDGNARRVGHVYGLSANLLDERASKLWTWICIASTMAGLHIPFRILARHAPPFLCYAHHTSQDG